MTATTRQFDWIQKGRYTTQLGMVQVERKEKENQLNHFLLDDGWTQKAVVPNHPPTASIVGYKATSKGKWYVYRLISKKKLEKSSGIKAATWQVEKKKKKRGFQANDDGNYYANKDWTTTSTSKDWTKLGARVSSVRKKNGKWQLAKQRTPLHSLNRTKEKEKENNKASNKGLNQCGRLHFTKT